MQLTGTETPNSGDRWSIARHSDTVIVAIGELDIAAVPALRQELTDAICDNPRLVLDVSAVTFLDAAALTVLLTAHRLADAGGGRLSLRAPNRAVRRMLELTGTTDLFRIDPSIDQARHQGRPDMFKVEHDGDPSPATAT